MTMASGVQAKFSLNTKTLMSQAHANVNITAKVFGSLGSDLKARLNSSYLPELAEACTCVKRVVVDYENVATELQTFLWVGRFQGESGKRKPSEVAKAKKNFDDSFRTTEQTHFKKIRETLYRRYCKLKETLNALDRKDGPVYRAANALAALEKKTKPIPLWRERLQKTGVVLGVLLGAACLVAVTGVAIAASVASSGAVAGVAVVGMKCLYAGLSTGAVASAGTAVTSYLLYDSREERARHHEETEVVQKALRDTKGHIVDMKGIEGAFNSLDILGDAADKDVDDIVQIFMDLFEPETGTPTYETTLSLVPKDVEKLKKWSSEVSQDPRVLRRSLPSPQSA